MNTVTLTAVERHQAEVRTAKLNAFLTNYRGDLVRALEASTDPRSANVLSALAKL